MKEKKGDNDKYAGNNNTTNSLTKQQQPSENSLKSREYFAVSYGGDEGASMDCFNPLENKLPNLKRFDDEYSNGNNMPLNAGGKQ